MRCTTTSLRAPTLGKTGLAVSCVFFLFLTHPLSWGTWLVRPSSLLHCYCLRSPLTNTVSDADLQGFLYRYICSSSSMLNRNPSKPSFTFFGESPRYSWQPPRT
ncbi:hypothetical protein BJX63DRAFT_364469 [Aspergillus granulosus]|uniref:Secreted protein n=1 Tax=Aspergillus granulosus TaxID=176169 RepID=A0ABR4H1S6_9EURO